MEWLLRYNQICDEKLPLVKIRKNNPKSEISLSQLLITRDVQNLHLDICFGGWQIRCNSLKFLCVSPKTSKSKMAANYGKKSRSWYEASGDKPEFRNLIHTPSHFVCHAHLIANFLSFHRSLVVVVNWGAGNALHGLEISMFSYFLKLYFIHISKDILLRWAQNAISQCKWYFSRKLLCQGLRNCTIGKSTIVLVRTAASYMIHDF